MFHTTRQLPYHRPVSGQSNGDKRETETETEIEIEIERQKGTVSSSKNQQRISMADPKKTSDPPRVDSTVNRIEKAQSGGDCLKKKG